MPPSFDPLHWWRDPRTGQILDDLGVIQQQLADLIEEQTAMSELIDELRTSVEAQQETIESVITLLSEVTTRVEDNVDDPDALREIIDDVRANTRKLADAVLTYKPPEGEEPPGEEPPSEEPPPAGDYGGDIAPPPVGGTGGGGGTDTTGTDTGA